jgi:ABC-type transporter MlaC component
MSELITPSPRTGKIAGLCLALLLATSMTAAALPANPRDSVRGFYDALLTTMMDGRTLGQSGRYARLAPVIGLNYRMHENAGSWQISDVYMDGSISQLATQRSEFHSILQRDGVDGLIMALNRKVDLLTRNVAKAS